MIKFNKKGIRTLREKKEMSRKELADLLSMHPRTISIWENCHDISKLKLTPDKIVELCNHFEVSSSFLFPEKKEEREVKVFTNEYTPEMIKHFVDKLEESYKAKEEIVEKLNTNHKEEMQELKRRHLGEKEKWIETISKLKEKENQLIYEVKHKDNIIKRLNEEIEYLKAQIDKNTSNHPNLFSDNNFCK